MNPAFSAVIALLFIAIAATHAADLSPVRFDATTGSLKVLEEGRTIFEGRVSPGAVATWEVIRKPVEPVFLGYPHGPALSWEKSTGLEAETVVVTVKGKDATVEGTVRASTDSLMCLPEGGTTVRTALGAAVNRLNRGVYDRTADWALWAPPPSRCEVAPSGKGSYTLKASGDTLSLELKRQFIGRHRGYTMWRPGNRLWKEPVMGWCSWAAYWQDVTEKDVLTAAEFLAKNLAPYGWNVIQIDDGFQRYNQQKPTAIEPPLTLADLWATPNEKFPGGLGALAKAISDLGLTPGIWFSVSLPPGYPNAWYVKDEDGKPHKGPWINYAPDGNNEEAIERTYLDVIRAWKKQGWRYFKIDTLRHLMYDSYRQVPAHFAAAGKDGDSTFRKVMTAIRKAIGPTNYTLACWGTLPEIAGVPDGCRIGEDVGPAWESVRKSAKYAAQFGFLNNIVWRNDPDYMCFRLPVEEGRSWATFIALSGQQMMVSDDPSAYDEPRLDILRRVGPTLFSRPSNLEPLKPDAELWQMDVAGPEPYTVLGRIAFGEEGLPEVSIAFDELGLPKGRYLIWDFWNARFVGEIGGPAMPAPALKQGECRVWAIRPALDRPQVLSTDRHISQGAQELSGVTWKDGVLSGKMNLPKGRSWRLFVHVPQGWRLTEASPGRHEVSSDGSVVTLAIESPDGRPVSWRLAFTRQGHIAPGSRGGAPSPRSGPSGKESRPR